MARLERPFRAADALEQRSPEQQLSDAMAAHGLHPPSVILDGRLHRFAVDKSDKTRAGWYVAYGDGIPAGRFGSWKDGTDEAWRAQIGRDLSPEETIAATRRLAELKAIRDAEAEARREVAAGTALAIWDSLEPCPDDHPYLTRKGVQGHGARVTADGRMAVPLFDAGGVLSSLQFIAADGEKRYLPGAGTRDCFAFVGDDKGEGVIYVAEGYATGATIHEVTGAPVVVAYSAGNLPGVTGIIRGQYPGRDIVIVADNDKSGVGLAHAEQAAAKHGARIVMPPAEGDANDFVQAGGDLASLLVPKLSDWLIPADDFASQPAPISWLIRGWLQQESLHMVHGPSGGGKTFLVLDWCLHMAASLTDWNGCRVKPGPVVYLAGEGHHGLRARIAAWKQEHASGRRLDLWLSRGGCDLDQAGGLIKVVDAIRALPVRPRLIVVDTLHRFLGGDENSAQDAKAMIDSCAELQREFGAAVLLVHHTGANPEAQGRARGSTAWRAALDLEASVFPKKGGGISLLQTKAKDSERQPRMALDLTPVEIEGWTDEDGEPVSSAILLRSDAGAEDDADVEAEEEGERPRYKAGAHPADHMRRFRNAWADSGKEVDSQGRPYLSRSALVDFLIGVGLSPSSARQIVKPSATGKMIGILVDAGWLTVHRDGWAVTHKPTAQAMTLERANAGRWQGTGT